MKKVGAGDMTPNRSQVEINGRIYDTKTGELISVVHSKSSVVKRRRVIDGFVRPSHINMVVNKVATPTKAHTAAPIAQKIHSKTQRTNRLHPSLSGISRPASGIKRLKPTQARSQVRSEVAANTPKSEVISRHNTVNDNEFVAKPSSTRQEERIAAPLPFIPRRFGKKERKENVADTSPDEEVEETSFFRKHLLPAAASFSALVLLGGFLIYNSLPTLTMRVAASRAGFNASVPSYQPSGYTFGGPVSYGPGRVVLKFESNTDDKELIITQKKSSWDSQSLLDNFLANETENYLTFEEHGLTVYLYNDSQATWVDDGVWYTVEGTAGLSSEQLLKIAASL